MILLTNINLSQNELQNAVIQPLATAPSNPRLGQIYYNSGDKILYQYDGANWQPVGGSGGGDVASVNGKTGVVVLNKSDIGLGNVDNTSDADKPISTATQTALDAKLAIAGGTMTGAIAMGSNKITGVGDATEDGDAVNLGQLNEAISTNTAFFRGSFANKAALDAVAWQTTDPTAENYVTNNDYAVVLDDETHDDEAWRYIYVNESGGSDNGWAAQYRLNEAPFTQTQLDAINSGANTTNIAQIGTNATAIATLQTRVNGLIATATGTIGTGSTSATVNFTGTLINAYAVMNGSLVTVDTAVGDGSITFSTAQAPTAAVTCVVVYAAAAS